jgi:carbonic anhydrase
LAFLRPRLPGTGSIDALGMTLASPGAVWKGTGTRKQNPMPFPQRLIEGYNAFAEGRLLNEQNRYRELAEAGQSPEIMVVGCCDSRVSPEVIFDARPGELFVVRNVANIIPPYSPDGQAHGVSAALEFAIAALKIKHIVVLGHARCGGVKAFAEDAEPLSPGDFIGKWMSLIAPAAETVSSSTFMTATERQTALERISIRYSIANLRTFPCVSILEGKGRLSLHGAWFDISSGELWVMNKETGDFERPELG